MTDQKSDEIITGGITSGDKMQVINCRIGEINRFFNELPIRILNSHEEPFFYLEDICKILGIKNPRKVIKILLTEFGTL